MSARMLWWIATGRGKCSICGKHADCPGWRMRRHLKLPKCATCVYAVVMAAALRVANEGVEVRA